MAAPSGPVPTSSDAEVLMFDFVDSYDRAYEAAAEELQCAASNVTQIVRRLEARGLVRRRRDTDPADRRDRLVVLTEAGQALHGQFTERFRVPRQVTGTAVRTRAATAGFPAPKSSGTLT